MNNNKIKSYAKVNLSLYVIGKSKSKLHRIESLISFINLHDEIVINKSNKKFHSIKFYGKFSKGIPKNNTLSKLFKYLDNKKLLGDKKYSLIVKKNIPQKSGMGGGSMNAAAVIKYLLKKKIIILKKKDLEKISDFVGSDVKLGLDNRNSILMPNGKVLKEKKRQKLHLLVVKPRMGCSTKIIYKNVKSYSKSNIKKKNNFGLKNLIFLRNDLEKIAIKKYPSLEKLKKILNKLPNIKFTRMTGSGSAFIAYFVSKNAAINASKILNNKTSKYWNKISKTI